MRCDVCGKKEATVHLTEIVNEQMTELHMCDGCARAKGAHIEEPFSLGDLLAGLVSLGKDLPAEKGTALTCHNCGLSYEHFKKLGKLGCGQCYDVFKDVLLPFLKRIHGSSKHAGHVPVKAGARLKYGRQVQTLQNKLQKAVELEEFEEAAKIRDQIKALEKDEKAEKKDTSLRNETG